MYIFFTSIGKITDASFLMERFVIVRDKKMSNRMDGEAARRIMSSEYARNGQIESGSFASRAQSAAQRNMNDGQVPDWSASANSGMSKGSGGQMRGGGRKN